jgi:flagellar M-ring protein FliF
MNEWFKKILDRIKDVWSKISNTQKLILAGVAVVFIGGMIMLIAFSASPSSVPVINTPITDPEMLNRITLRLDEEGIPYTLSRTNQVLVSDSSTARRATMILFRENLIPSSASPWDIFNRDAWTITDFERNVQLRQAITRDVQRFIESLDGVDNAEVILVLPEEQVFQEMQEETTASIILTPAPGSNLAGDRAMIEGIQSLVLRAVEGLAVENIIITDHNGLQLNDFESLASFDDLKLAERQMKLKREYENKYRFQILSELEKFFPDRVSIINVDVSLDFSRKNVDTKEFFPVTRVEDNPETPFSELEVQDNIIVSRKNTDVQFEGSGFNPEGPAGQEGQTAPGYEELDNMIGRYTNQSTEENFNVNERITAEEKPPWEAGRRSIAVAIDGQWEKVYNSRGEVELDEFGRIQRQYIPVSDEDLQKAGDLIQKAINFSSARADSVSVQHLQRDRTLEFEAENEALRNARRLRETIIYSLISLTVIVIVFIVLQTDQQGAGKTATAAGGRARAAAPGDA